MKLFRNILLMHLSGKLTSLKLESLITLHDLCGHHTLNLQTEYMSKTGANDRNLE